MIQGKAATFFIGSLAGGGAEGVCVNIANGLVNKGWKIELIVLHLNDAVNKDKLDNRVKVTALGVRHARYSLWKLNDYFKKTKPKVVLVFSYELAVLTVLLRSVFRYQFKILARNISTISFRHSKELGKSLWRRQVVEPLIDAFFYKVDHVVNQCEAMEQDLLTVYPRLKGKTSYIYNPVSEHIERYADECVWSEIEKEDFYLCVGRLEVEKEFHLAIEAFSLVAWRLPSLRLKIVGKGSMESALRRRAKELGVERRVDFEGYNADLIPYYTRARATILTSSYEGFPNVLIESIMLGTPVISFDIPSGPSEIVIDKENGFLVKNRKAEELSQKMLDVLSYNFNPSQIHKKAKEKYSLVLGLSKYESLISSSK